jgi:hypothetical protein
MNTKNHENPEKTMTLKKMFVILSLILAGSLAANSAYSQVRVGVNFESSYPGYTYYTYPAWHGHYRDRSYYAHYHARFEREHKGYLTGRRFDHDRFERENHWHARP